METPENNPFAIPTANSSPHLPPSLPNQAPSPTTSVTFSTEERLMAIAVHASLLVGFGVLWIPLIVMLCTKDKPLLRQHAVEALNFHLFLSLISLALILFGALGSCIILPVFFSIISIGALAICGVVFSILAILQASNDCPYRYPGIFRIIR